MKRVLIANRGEIALRIVRACHEEEVEAVAVYSAADRASPHVRAADQAVAIGPASPSQSYLNIDRLVARHGGCDLGSKSVHRLQRRYGSLRDARQHGRREGPTQ